MDSIIADDGAPAMIPSLWIDTDIALGASRGDVDDGFALAAALSAHRRGECVVRGVSTVAGNTDVRTATECARALILVMAMRAEIPLFSGDSPEAAEKIAALPVGTEIVALGPMTNVARALAIDPALASRTRVRLVGTNLTSHGRFAPWWPFEFNLRIDAPSARAVFASTLRRRVFPLDSLVRLRADRARLEALAKTSPLGQYLAESSWRWLSYARLRYLSTSFPVWDLVPTLDALGLLSPAVHTRHVRLEGRGRLITDDRAPPTDFATDFDPDAAWREFVALVSP